MKCRILIIVLFFSCPVLAQERLSYQQAHADIDYYFATIDSIHPNLYWYTSRAAIDSFKFALKERIRDSIDILEFSSFLAQGSHFFDYHTGHSYLWTDYYIDKCDSIFPMIEIKNGEVFLKNKSYRILAINDYPIHKILTCVMNNFGADLPLQGIYLDINMSMVFQNTLMYMNIYPPYKVKVNDGKANFIINLNSLDSWELKTDLWDKYEKYRDYDEPYSFAIYPDSSVAIIYFNMSVVGKEKGKKFYYFLESCFEQIKAHNISFLFIDNSRNIGGASITTGKFFNFLQIDRPVRTVYRWKEKVMTKRGQWKMKIVRAPLKIPSVKGFQGKIFVYQSFKTQSAGPVLCQMFKILGIGKLVGTNTERAVYNYNNPFPFYLPNSHLLCRVSTRYFLPNKGKHCQVNEKGEIEPDIPYPFLIDRRLDVEDCMKIIELYDEGRN